jgi:hypothetical protein
MVLNTGYVGFICVNNIRYVMIPFIVHTLMLYFVDTSKLLSVKLL